MARFEKELDVVSFMRKQLKLSAIFENVLTKKQKSLVRTNTRFTLEDSVSEGSDGPGPSISAVHSAEHTPIYLK